MSFEVPDEAEDRFWTEVVRGPGHWGWTGARTRRRGAPQVFAGGRGGAYISAARIAWVLCRGALPEGHDVVAECGAPLCLNPEHLTLARSDDLERACRCGRAIRRRFARDPWPEFCHVCRRAGRLGAGAVGSGRCLGDSPADCEVGWWHNHCECGEPKSLNWPRCATCRLSEYIPPKSLYNRGFLKNHRVARSKTTAL